MIRMIATLLLLAVLAPATAEDPIAGDGVVKTETRKLAAFHEIEYTLSGNLRVTIGKPTPLKIEGDGNILPLIHTEVQKGRLIISATKPFRSKNGPNITVTIPDLEVVRIAGSGDVRISGLDNKSFFIEISGSADLFISGKTESLTTKVAGSADVRAYKLVARKALVSAAGSADVWINVAEALQANVMGSGNIFYLGNPKVVANVIGTGDVHKAKKAPKENKKPDKPKAP